VLLDAGPLGLVLAALLAHLAVLPLAWYGFTRYFDLRRTWAAVRRGSLDREVLAFGLPQSVNMMFNYGLVRVDSLMLSAFISADRVGVYTLVTELARTIRVAKTSFSSVFSPLVAKYKALSNRRGLVESLHLISRWTSALSVPLLFVIMALYPEVILGPGSRWTESLWFPWLLTLGPMMSCFFGLAGNLLLMTGHARLLLLNSSVMMVVNVLLNLALIPPFGLLGAATATMVSNALISVLQVVQMKVYEGVTFTAEAYAKPLAAAALTCLPIALVNTSFGHDLLYGLGDAAGFALKIALVLACVGAYAALIFLWPGKNPEREWLATWWRARRNHDRPPSPRAFIREQADPPPPPEPPRPGDRDAP
jgi:O-antigen/teichoic acid export membrane protein